MSVIIDIKYKYDTFKESNQIILMSNDILSDGGVPGGRGGDYSILTYF